MLIAGRRTLEVALSSDDAERACAKLVGLVYVADDTPGFRRKKRGKSFVYVDAAGRTIADEATLARIRSLAVPPAYRDVWICADPNGHLQATGRDARGRKQYRYHPRWREVRDAVKYTRMIAFGEALPKIRAHADRDLSRAGLPREKILAAVVELLDRTHMRVGNDEYARDNDSYGLTTLRARHARVVGATVKFEFRGKSGKTHRVGITDRRLAKVVRRCLEIPGLELFRYVDEGGATRAIGSGDVNDYLRSISGEDFTAKDFRTWAGTVRATRLLAAEVACATKHAKKRAVVAAIAEVSNVLGNTPAVCKKSYVHPAVLEAFAEGWIAEVKAPRAVAEEGALGDDERLTLALLRAAESRPKPTLKEQLARSIQSAAKKKAA